MSPNNNNDSNRVQPMQHIPMAPLISADRPIYLVPLSHNDEGNPYVSMQDVYVVLQYSEDILIFKDEYQKSPVLIQGVTDGNQGWIPFFPNRTLYFRCPNQEDAPNSSPLSPPLPPTRTRRGSTRLRISRRGSPPPLPPQVDSATTPSPPRSGFYAVSPSLTTSPRTSPTRSSDDGTITSRFASPSPRSTGSRTPYARPSSTGCLSGARHTVSSNQGQQSPQPAGQAQPNVSTSPSTASPPTSTTPTATATGSYDSATSSSACGSDHGRNPGPSAPVTGQSQRGSQCDDELRGMISDLEEWRDETTARDLQRYHTVSQVLTETTYLNQCNQNLQRDNQELQRQLHALQQDYQAIRQDNQAFYQDICSFREANGDLVQGNHDLQQENQTIHQNLRDLRNLNQLHEQEICDLRNQNMNLRHREGSFVCINCDQCQQGGSGAASTASSYSSSRSMNPHGPSSHRRLAHAPPQNPQALPSSGEVNQSHIGGSSAPHQRKHAAMHQYDRVGSASGASDVESPISGTSPTLPPQSIDAFDEDDPTSAAAATLVMVSQGQSRVLSEHDSPAAQRSSSSLLFAPAAAGIAEFAERDNMDPYNSGTRDYRVHSWVQEIDEGGYTSHAEYEDEDEEEDDQREGEEVEECKDYELEEGEMEEGEVEGEEYEESEDEQ